MFVRYAKFVLMVATLVASSSHAFASDDFEGYSSSIDLRLKLGNKRSLVSPELFIPLRYDDTTLLFADIRGVGDDAGATEANLGFGLRTLDNEAGAVNGVYGFFDRRRSQFDNYFSQITVGAERLTEDWDFRGNVYMPVSRVKDIKQLPATSFISGSGLFVQSDLTQEKALRGVDFEVGHTVFGRDDTRLFVGGYRFWGSDVPEVKGWRGRLQVDVDDWLRIGGEIQHDHIRGTNSYLEARLRFPFGENKKSKLKGLRARMVEPIVRDIDIVTQQGSTPSPQIYEAVNVNTGTAQKIYFVDNSVASNGDGSIESPFDNTADAIAAVAPYDTIYILAGDGTSTNMDVSHQLNQPNIKFLGEGVALTYDTSDLEINGNIPLPADGFVIREAGAKPNLTAAFNAPVININADGIEVAGVLTNGVSSNSGINISNVENIYIHDILTSGNDNGISISASGANNTSVKMERVSAVGNATYNVNILDLSTGTINADLGGGSLGSVGQNNISGAGWYDINVDLDGGALSAQNNYFGKENGGAITWVGGIDSGNIDASNFLTSATCTDCLTDPFSFTTQTGVATNTNYTSNEITVGGFVGKRYFVHYPGDVYLNNVLVGGYALVEAGDKIKVRKRSAIFANTSIDQELWLGGEYETFTLVTAP